MKIKKVLIVSSVEEKIFKKHGVRRKEIEEGLLTSRSLFYRVRDGKYMALTLGMRYTTIIFTYTQGIAEIRTAYPSSDWQIRLYKRKSE